MVLFYVSFPLFPPPFFLILVWIYTQRIGTGFRICVVFAKIKEEGMDLNFWLECRIGED
jgi:hypothetical protein